MYTIVLKLTAYLLLVFTSSSLLHADQFTVQFNLLMAPEKWVDQHQLGNIPKEISDDFFKKQAQLETIDILSAPRVTAIANQEATIIIQEAPLTYMEKVGDGYQPRIMPKGTEPGIKITAKINRVENKPGYILLDWSTNISTLSGREPVPFELDVGKPIMQVQKYDSRIECFNDRWYFLSKTLPFEAGSDKSALIFCKVQNGESPKSENLPIQLVSDSVSFDSDKGILKANGNVQIHEKDFVIYSDKLEFIQEKQKTKGPAIQADAMTLETLESRVRYSGNVRLRIPGGVIHSQELYIQQLVDAPRVASAFEKRLKQTIIPNLSFENVSIKDAINFLREMSGQHSPDGKRVEFVLSQQVDANVTVTLELRNLSLYHVIRILTQSCGQDFVMDEEAGVIHII